VSFKIPTKKSAASSIEWSVGKNGSEMTERMWLVQQASPGRKKAADRIQMALRNSPARS
jgi:hypothetical protein